MDANRPIFDFADFRDRITSPALRAIADHWQEARGRALMPSWSQIRPSCIAPHLTQVWCFKYDRDADEFTARLAGNRIMTGFGKSFRGTTLEELHPATIVDGIHITMRRLVLEPCIYRSSGSLFRVGPRVTEGERIMLPLAADGCCGDGVLGASEYDPVPTSGEQVEIILDNEEWYSLANGHLPPPWRRPWRRS